MICLDEFRELMILDEHPFKMPTTVILEPADKEELVLDQLALRYTKLIDEWQAQERDRFHTRETRYDGEHPEPSFPILVSHTKQSLKARPDIILLDGRRATMLDHQRIQTRCGIQEILTLETAQGLRKRPGYTRLCPSCGGKHLPTRLSSTPTDRPSNQPIPCQKCHADLHSSSYFEDQDTLVCRCCGMRYHRPLQSLTTIETDANDQVITDWLHTNAIHEDGHTSRPEADETSDDTTFLDEPLEESPVDLSEDPDLLSLQEGTEQDGISPYDDDVTVAELPETTPISMDELQQIFHLLNHPEERDSHMSQPSVVQHLIALAEHRMTDLNNHEEFKEVFGKVVSEEISSLSDLLHEPAYNLFQMAHSPMRQALIDQALQQKDNPDTRMAVWAAAGRLVKECQLPWLSSFSINRTAMPPNREARTQFLLDQQAQAKANVQPIVEWLLQLSADDLATLAGDPESTHPFLHHPDPSVFEGTDTLMAGLITYLANGLQRFREKQTGCRVKAADHGLAVETLRAIAIQSGQLPAPGHSKAQVPA